MNSLGNYTGEGTDGVYIHIYMYRYRVYGLGVGVQGLRIRKRGSVFDVLCLLERVPYIIFGLFSC